jgi:Zinc knuckle
VIWGQCSEAMRNKLRALDDFNEENKNNNCIWLLNEIKGVTHQFDTKRNMYLSLLDARIAYFTCRQTANQTNAEYLAVFSANVQVLEYYKATISESHLLVDNLGGTRTTEERQKIARDCTIAMAFLKGADPRRYGALWTDLANQKNRGNDQYPQDLTAAYSMIVNYQPPSMHRVTNQTANVTNHAANGTPNQGANHDTQPVPTNIVPHTFAQAARSGSSTMTNASVVPGNDGITHDTVTCFNCNVNGHYANACPSAVSLVQHAYLLTQSVSGEQRYVGIPSTWIVLDSQLSISVFKSANMVANIQDSPQPIVVRTNGEQQTSTQIADLINFGRVWFNPESIANILSLSEVRKVCRVTMDTAEEASMCIHKKNGALMKFKEHKDGLFYYDTASNGVDTDIEHHILVQSVTDNKAKFVTREIEAADKARDLYRKLGRPSQAKFEEIITKNIVLSCPVTVDDVQRA